MKKVYILLLVVFSMKANGQERFDEPQPKIVSSIKTLDQFTGWMKNDLGIWTSANKAVPNTDPTFRGVLKYCEQLVKIEWCKIEYEEKVYLCFSKFSIFQFEKWNRVNTQYPCDFWLLSDTTLNSDIFAISGETKHISIPVIVNGSPLGTFTPMTWKQILLELKKVLKEKNSDAEAISDTENFDFQYRVSKSKSIQFTFGKSSGRCDVGDSELSNSYYETTLSNMRLFFSTIISN